MEEDTEKTEEEEEFSTGPLSVLTMCSSIVGTTRSC